MNYASEFSNVAPKTKFTKDDMEAPIILLDKALSYMKNVIIGCEGIIYYLPATGVLTWTGDIHIYFISAAGLTIGNDILAGSLTLTDGQIAYVDLSESNGANLTMTAASFSTGSASNFLAINRLVMGYRNSASDMYYPVYLDAKILLWDDVFLPLAVTKLGSTAPTWSPFFGNLSRYKFAINDFVEGDFEIPHDYCEGTDLKPHCHVVTSGAETGMEVRYSLECWMANMGSASITTSTPTSADLALPTAQGHHFYYSLGTISGAGLSIGALVSFLFKRIALTSGSNPVNNPFVVQVGVHYLKDRSGSKTESSK